MAIVLGYTVISSGISALTSYQSREIKAAISVEKRGRDESTAKHEYFSFLLQLLRFNVYEGQLS